jgi:hypothetical protein
MSANVGNWVAQTLTSTGLKRQQKQNDVFVEVEELRAKGDDAKTMEFVANKNFTFQAQFFLNSRFEYLSEEQRELIFTRYYKGMQKMDKDQWAANGKNVRDYLETGNLSLEWGAKFTEIIFKEEKREPLTYTQFQKEFKEIDSTRDKKLSLVEFLVWHLNTSIKDLMAGSQLNDFDISNKRQALNTANAAPEAWEKKKQGMEEIIKNGSAVESARTRNELKQHDLQKPDPMDVNTAQNNYDRAVKKAKKSSNPPGLVWWQARLVREENDLKPQKKQS